MGLISTVVTCWVAISSDTIFTNASAITHLKIKCKKHKIGVFKSNLTNGVFPINPKTTSTSLHKY